MLAESLNEFANLLEYTTGTSGIGTKYMSRSGSPGHYSYVYPNDAINRLARGKYKAFARFIKKSQIFISKISSNYGITRMQLKNLSWSHQMATGAMQQGTRFRLGINLQTHKLYGYRSKLQRMGAYSKLNALRKKGILRYR